MSRVEYLTRRAGSIAIHNARTLHHSPVSKSPVPRLLLLNCYTSADAESYTPHSTLNPNASKVVLGVTVRWAEHDPRPCRIPPGLSGGYTSIYATHAVEDNADGKSTGGMMWKKTPNYVYASIDVERLVMVKTEFPE